MNNEKKMILKKMDIEGFKSFAKQTHIEFADKISAILGPNNVGKTNILDSIQWALSDENADVSVIFSGTADLPAHNFAEVTLIFDEFEKDNVNTVVKRRIERKENGSLKDEHFINGEKLAIIDFSERLSAIGMSNQLSWSFEEILLNHNKLQLSTDAFCKVKKLFQAEFSKIIENGNAELRAATSIDLLDTGIEIYAQFPNKKLLHYSYLSKTEKFLTSLILLLALYKAYPKPLFLLDDVDSYFDEVNHDLFVTILKVLCEETQCIIVTQKKETVMEANTMLGVTAEETCETGIITLKCVDKIMKDVEAENE